MERAPFEPRGSLLRQDNGINHVNYPVTAEDVGFGHFGVVNHHHSPLTLIVTDCPFTVLAEFILPTWAAVTIPGTTW